jgi:hypothetical protein
MYGKKTLVIPVGVTVETVKGFLAYASPNSIVIGVYLDDGKYIDQKRQVLDVLKVACDGIGAEFYECGINLFNLDISKLLSLLEGADEIYLETVTGSRLICILLLKTLYEYSVKQGVKCHLILGVEGESPSMIIDIKSLFSSSTDLGPLQRKTLLSLSEKTASSVDEFSKAIGVSKWTLYKTLLSLIRNGLVERTKRGTYSLTIMGKIIANLEAKISE